MKRIALVVDKNLSLGEQANIVAILSGALSRENEGMYDSETLLDKSGVQHAGIKNSLVVLKSKTAALSKFITQASENEEISSVVFTRNGQALNDKYSEYKELIRNNELENLEPVGIGVYGGEAVIREMTKKFSLLR
ncbi:Protein of unknown function [Pilibacter termitis]|uniref:DUF2000 domain-containing protein n=1 Tax=Pilibacter termitis TaxID=263852 RepID=A0A1T4RFV0_9ENTE|nr:DUF2000 domain-containing protein [Pilibacter termitis]SKA14767.1 Protein of unknown function [Pilibacter termitis]